jgi:hypothetical protein
MVYQRINVGSYSITQVLICIWNLSLRVDHLIAQHRGYILRPINEPLYRLHKSLSLVTNYHVSNS